MDAAALHYMCSFQDRMAESTTGIAALINAPVVLDGEPPEAPIDDPITRFNVATWPLDGGVDANRTDAMKRQLLIHALLAHRKWEMNRDRAGLPLDELINRVDELPSAFKPVRFEQWCTARSMILSMHLPDQPQSPHPNDIE